MVRTGGLSMIDGGIYPEDLLVVDRSLEAQHCDFCGRTAAARRKFLYDRYKVSKKILNTRDEGWSPKYRFNSKFLC